MDTDALHGLMKKIILVLTVIWGIFLLPSFMLVIFASEGLVGFPTQSVAAQHVLYYNIVAFPFVLLISIGLSWLCLKYKKYWPAIAFALLPLLTFLVEIIAADIALFLS